MATVRYMIVVRSCTSQLFGYSNSEVKLAENTVRSCLVCPECGFPMVLFASKEAKYLKSGKPRRYYRCANNRECDTVCGAHPDGTPLGVPGNKETRLARIELHEVFDPLWQSGRWSRTEAYTILQILTGWGKDEAHIACFDKTQCEWVKGQIEEFLKLNPLQDQTKNGFVHMKRECVEHGWETHRVYLEGMREFCVSCLDRMKGPVWWAFLVFKRSLR